MDIDDSGEFSDDEIRSASIGSSTGTSSAPRDDTRRAHHNALERVRRDHIKDCFASLKDVVPNVDPERASRAGILKGTIDYITRLEQQISSHEADVNELQRQNDLLEAEIREADSGNNPPSQSQPHRSSGNSFTTTISRNQQPDTMTPLVVQNANNGSVNDDDDDDIIVLNEHDAPRRM